MDRKEFLQTISIFQSLSEAQLEALSKCMTRELSVVLGGKDGAER